MSTKRRVLLPTITGIVPSSPVGTVGTLDIPIGSGFRLHDLQIVYIDGGGAPTDVNAMFSDMGIYRNGTPQRTYLSSADLDHANNINGSQYGRQQVNTAAAMRQTMTHFFAEPWRKDKVDTDVLAWNVCAENGWKTLQVKMKLATAMPATGSIVAYAWIEDVPSQLRGVAQSIKKVYAQQIPASGLTVDVTTLDQKDAYQLIALKHPTTGLITKVSLSRRAAMLVASTMAGHASAPAAFQSPFNTQIYGGSVTADPLTGGNFTLTGNNINLGPGNNVISSDGSNLILNPPTAGGINIFNLNRGAGIPEPAVSGLECG